MCKNLLYKTREVTLTNGRKATVSNETTKNAVFDENEDYVNENAERFDENIYYYCPDDMFVNCTDEEIGEYVSIDTEVAFE